MKRRTSRARERGAAMVEGAVVLPVLAVFFGIMMYVHNAYFAKLQIQGETRFKAFDNAAHACVGGGSVGEVLGVPSGPVPFWADAPDDTKEEALETTFLETKANATKVAVALNRSRTVTAESGLYCNPYAFGFNLPYAGAAALVSGLGSSTKILKFMKWTLQFLPLFGGGVL